VNGNHVAGGGTDGLQGQHGGGGDPQGLGHFKLELAEHHVRYRVGAGDKGPQRADGGAERREELPTSPAAKFAVVTGMLARSAPLTPELMKMRTMGTVKISTKPAPIRVRLDSPVPARRERGAHCSKVASRAQSTSRPRQVERLNGGADPLLPKGP
jgi:hypothetical protein